MESRTCEACSKKTNDFYPVAIPVQGDSGAYFREDFDLCAECFHPIENFLIYIKAAHRLLSPHTNPQKPPAPPKK